MAETVEITVRQVAADAVQFIGLLLLGCSLAVAFLKCDAQQAAKPIS